MIYRETKGAPLSAQDIDGNFRACMGVHNLLHVQDQEPIASHGGDFIAGAWRTRVLNTVVYNTIQGASLTSNQITLPAGTYYTEALAPAYKVNLHILRIQKISPTTSTLIHGTSIYANQTYNVNNHAIISGVFSLSEESIVELQHSCTATNATSGLGVGSADIGQLNQIFAEIKIWKLS